MIITVPTIVTDNTRRPALPDNTGFTLIEDHGDMMTVQTSEDVTDWAIENGYLIPKTVSMRKGRLALLAAGLLDQIDDAIAAIADENKRKAVQIEWEYAQVIDRDSPLVRTFADQLSMSEDDLDELFRQAWSL